MTPRTDRTSLWVLVIASAASCMTALDTLAVTTALTTIRHDLGVAFGVLLMTASALGDRFGRRRMLAL